MLLKTYQIEIILREHVLIVWNSPYCVDARKYALVDWLNLGRLLSLRLPVHQLTIKGNP